MKKVLFPPQPSVSRYIEKSALQFKIKGTSFILELVCFEEYKPVPSAQPDVNTRHSATWAATLFNPRWEIELGAETSSGRLESFFPSTTGGKVGSQEGFREFMIVISKVADLLGCNRAEGEASELLQADFGMLF